MTEYARKRFLDPAILDQAVREIGAIAKKAGVDLVLIGGYAMQLYGSPRLTGDIDFASDALLEDLVIEAALSFGGMRTRTSAQVPVDIILRSDDFASLYMEAISNAQHIEGVPVYVARPEYLSAMKMVAGRSGKDDADLEFLVSSGVADIVKTREVIHEHLGPYAAKEFDATVEIIEWKKSRGRIE